MKKRILSAIISLLLIFSVMPTDIITAFAESTPTATSGTIYDATWSLDGTVLTISGCDYMGDFSSYNPAPWGKAITEVRFENYSYIRIGSYFFYECSKLKAIDLSDVKYIGANAFAGCTSLEGVDLSSAKNIGWEAFADCTALKQITMPDFRTSYSNTTFENSAYWNNPDNWEGELLYIGKHLVGSKNLNEESEVVLKNGTIDCAGNALDNIKSLEVNPEFSGYAMIRTKELKFAQGYTTIDWDYVMSDSAFEKIEKITIPGTVSRITIPTQLSNYNNKNNIKTFSVSEDNPYFSSAGNCIVEKSTKTLKIGCNTTVIPTDGSVEKIGRYAFLNCRDITEITIPDTVKTIEENAFYKCAALATVNLPNKLKFISSYAFSDCSALNNVVIPESIEVLGYGAFYYCTALDTVSLPDEVFNIETDAFNGTKLLNDFKASTDSVLYLGKHLIKAKSDVSADYEITEGTVTIAGGAFKYTDVDDITVPDSVEYVGHKAFDGTPICYSDNYTDGAIYLGKHLIKVDSKLTEYTVKDGTKTIYDNAFCYSNIKNVTLPEGLIAIGDKAFYECEKLESVNIPNSVKYIGSNVFFECNGLKEIHIPDSAVSVSDNAFMCTTGLKKVTASGGNKLLKFIDGCLINTENKTLLRGIGNFTIPNDGSVTTIVDYAFYKNTDIENIHIPASVISMNETAFSYTANLKNITADRNCFCAVDNCLVNIEKGEIIAVGVNCRIPIDEYITTINMDVFTDKVGIKEIYIPKNITEIGTPYQLTTCQLENIGVSPENEVYSAKNNCLIKKDEYSEGKNIVASAKNATIPTDSDITTIDRYAFANTDSLTKITIPDNITNIDECAFFGCESLKELNIGKGVNSISYYAFNDCKKLAKITVSEENNGFYESGNCLLSGKGTDSHSVILGTVNSVIPTDPEVQNIAFYAFYGTEIEKLVIPENIKNIDGGAITDSDYIKAVSILGNDTEFSLSYYTDYEVFPYCPNLTVYCNQGAKAATQLEEAGANWKYHCTTHSFKATTTSATCVNKGKTVKRCEKCPFEEVTEIAMNPNNHLHTTVVNTKKATATADGYTGDTMCKDCVKLVKKGATVSKASNITLSATSYTYDGKAKKPTVTVKSSKGTKLTLNKDYTVAYASGRTNAGTYKVTITLKGNYSGTVVKSFKINAKKVTPTVSNYSSKTYNGKAQTQKLTVKVGKTTLKASQYTVKYTSNKLVGTATVKVTLKGNYSGSKTVTFKINPIGTSLKSVAGGKKRVTVKWKKQGTQTSGYQVQYSTSKSFKGAKTVTVTSNKTTSKTIKSLKGGKKYYVRVRTYKTVGKTKYYSVWSTAKNATAKK